MTPFTHADMSVRHLGRQKKSDRHIGENRHFNSRRHIGRRLFVAQPITDEVMVVAAPTQLCFLLL